MGADTVALVCVSAFRLADRIAALFSRSSQDLSAADQSHRLLGGGRLRGSLLHALVGQEGEI